MEKSRRKHVIHERVKEENFKQKSENTVCVLERLKTYSAEIKK